MPLNYTAAHSSRISKPSLKRSASSPFSLHKQRKPISRASSKPEAFDEAEDYFGDRLEDRGLVKTLATDLSLRDVAQTIKYIRSHMFDDLPEAGGFNSVRISEILRFRKSLPPTVTVTHVHAFLRSPTATDKEIAELAKAGVVRKIVVPGRGTGSSSIAEGVILYPDFERLVHESGLDEEIANTLLQRLQDNPLLLNLPSNSFTASEAAALKQAGFLTSSSQGQQPSTPFTHATSPGTLTSLLSVSRAPSGSLAAVGGESAIHDAGGSGTASGIRRSSSQLSTENLHSSNRTFQISLPNTGPYLRLLTAARAHLIALLQKSRFKEMPLYMLRERWDGGIASDDPAARAKKYRGEFTGVLPARTKKWKRFYGLRFEWVLAECLGAGLLELFETGSVGRAARIV
ncbi:MAG: hypothetical protein HETSPECPRED_005663 [Heterodermia speciosa]|uniref:Serine-threonine protein kinase 19 n=1 Tax=Heterodermia speciosa TaxID=116794 RepID=A0A8H3IMQ1_9LECA|nr:MAG: hypothetical protein HETSPECPRED_005663 [Heterodermia speciosa]